MIVYKQLTGASSLSVFQNWDWSQYLPQNGQPGPWVKALDNGGGPRLCFCGFHGWLRPDGGIAGDYAVYLMELRDPVVTDSEKAVALEARLLRLYKDRHGKIYPPPRRWE